MNEQAKKATKQTRRWLKVSLRTFLLAITVLCVWLDFIVNRANKQNRQAEHSLTMNRQILELCHR